jgi:hypothetical protein
MSVLNETFVINMNGQEVVVIFNPSDESPFRKTDSGNMSMTVDGNTTDYPYVKTSFIPLPFQWPKK